MPVPPSPAARRLPVWSEIWPVYSIALFLASSWALYRVFWYVPSWLEYLSLWSILLIIAYVLSFALLEGALLAAPAVLLALVLPRRLFRVRFIAQGSAVTLALGAGAFLVQRQVAAIYRLELWQLIAFPLLALAGLALAGLAAGAIYVRFPRLQSLVEAFANRMTVFGLLYSVLGLASWLVVIVRNLV
jgi:hypothetical protein